MAWPGRSTAWQGTRQTNNKGGKMQVQLKGEFLSLLSWCQDNDGALLNQSNLRRHSGDGRQWTLYLDIREANKDIWEKARDNLVLYGIKATGVDSNMAWLSNGDKK
jgi:hypothetical protein